MVTQCFASPKSIATVAKIAECHTLHDPPMECNGMQWTDRPLAPALALGVVMSLMKAVG